jgi:hypothetical protein
MNAIKKTIATLFVSTLLVAGSSAVYAEEAAKAAATAPATTSEAGIAEAVAHLQEALALAGKSDFSAATLHLKAARNTAAEISGHALDVHKGVTDINNSMKAVKLGHPEEAVAEIEKAIAVFKAIKL